MAEQVFFHLTGKRSGSSLRPVAGAALRPALFAPFHDLTRLRYDFPVVLVEREADGPFVRSLSGLVDALLRDIAPRGTAGERLRRNVLRLEREVRAMLTEGAAGTLSSLWDRAAGRLVARGGEPVASDLARARAALPADGEVLDCGATMPMRLVTHAWRSVQARKAREMRRHIDALVVRLSDLVRADLLRSEAGRRADALRAGVGTPHQDLFDFEVMSRLLAKPSGASALSESRRRRIEGTLAVLRAERFFGDGAYGFAFDRADAALAAFRERLPTMAELVRAIAIAELEAQGRYVEAKHDDYFRGFDERSLRPEDRALFPDYLVRLDARASYAAGLSQLIAALTSGAPLKILVETDDVFGLGAQLATAAMGLGDAFVLQSASAHLYRAVPNVLAALGYPGAALLSVFSAADGACALPPYLVSAAAMESRAFPAFTYDPSAGPDWAHRFSLADNPQPERTWPVHPFAFADEEMQRVVEPLPFTLADFALCDPRRSGHFAIVPREHWNGDLVPIGDSLVGASSSASEATPCVYAIDTDNRLHKLVVDEALVRAASRCAEAWHRLRELEQLKRGYAPAPEPNAEAAAAAPVSVAAPGAPGVAVPAAGAPARPEKEAARPGEALPPGRPSFEEERSADELYIETPRCTSCNECIQINSRMFAYDGKRQAYIADPDAGTYRELVEAAESCQVAIIHPGRPRDPNEPGLEELLQRAAPFR